MEEIVVGKALYVGNLPFTCKENELHDLFATIGAVDNVRIISDRETGRSKGFGFVEMLSEEEAGDAVKKFDGYECEGRILKVSFAVYNSARRGGATRRDEVPNGNYRNDRQDNF